MSGRYIALVVGLVALGAGCDSGSDGAEKAPGPPPPPASADVAELEGACREVYERLPQPTRDATSEDEFVEHCLAALSGRPDPGIPHRT